MTITRAKAITNVYVNDSVVSMQLNEAADYKAITDDAVVWAMEHEPRLFYDLVLRYLQHLENTEHRTCSTCKHCADFVDGDSTCNHGKARLGQ